MGVMDMQQRETLLLLMTFMGSEAFWNIGGRDIFCTNMHSRHNECKLLPTFDKWSSVISHCV